MRVFWLLSNRGMSNCQTKSPSKLQSIASFDRIPSLDFLRGISILGILFINIESFAYPEPWSPWKFGFDSPIDRHTRFWVYFLTQGKFYTMFALLFGVGFYIFLERLDRKNLGLRAMDIYSRRLIWLFVIGVMHAYLVWNGDVLYHYSVCGCLLFPFRSIKTHYLVLIVLFLASLQLIKSSEQTSKRQKWKYDYEKALAIPVVERNEADQEKIQFWERKISKKSPDTSTYKARKPEYIKGVKETYREMKVHKGLLYYQGLLFPSLIAMILGIVFYRSGIFVNYRVWRYYWPISLVILGIAIVINYLRYYQWTYEYYYPVVSSWLSYMFTFPKEMLGVAYILIINGLYQRFCRRSRVGLISIVGRMALSNYIFQNILLGIIFYGYGMSMYNQFSRFELIGIVVLIWVLQITLSSLWSSRYPQGPLEWLWRKLTYAGFK